MELPIVPPHLLTAFLMSTGRLKLNAAKTRAFWRHHAERSTPLMIGFDPFEGNHLVEPLGLYSDEAEYTVSKEKILVVLCSTQDAIAYNFGHWVLVDQVLVASYTVWDFSMCWALAIWT